VPVFALTQGPPIVIVNTPSGQQISTSILPEIAGYNLYFSYRDKEFEEIAEQDMALVYSYVPIEQSNKPMYVVIEMAQTRSSLHPWEVCLITWPATHGYQPSVTQIDLKDIQLIQNPPIISRFFVFNYTATNQTQAVLYWFESAIFTANATSQQKHVKISLITYPENPDDLPLMEQQMVTIGTAIASYWEPIKTWSQIALLLSQQGAYLALTISALLIPLAILYILQERKQRKANTAAYQKLPTQNKQIIDAVLETEKTTTPTLKAIATTYKNKTTQPIEEQKLLQKLSETEKIGIVKGYIANKHDNPTQIWKTQMT
jgi:hypothetical protein